MFRADGARGSAPTGIVRAVPITIRPIEADELVAWYAAVGFGFFIWPSDPEGAAERRGKYIELPRTIGAFDGAAIAGTFRTFGTTLTLPGNGEVPVSAVTAVTVRPTHRRLGILSNMIANDVAMGVERGDVASVLIASEWPIYGRFGYGPATWHARWTLRTRAARFELEPSGSSRKNDSSGTRVHQCRQVGSLWISVSEGRYSIRGSNGRLG